MSRVEPKNHPQPQRQAQPGRQVPTDRSPSTIESQQKKSSDPSRREPSRHH